MKISNFSYTTADAMPVLGASTRLRSAGAARSAQWSAPEARALAAAAAHANAASSAAAVAATRLRPVAMSVIEDRYREKSR